jgi:ATP-dependent Clp protease adapter protein ClpS
MDPILTGQQPAAATGGQTQLEDIWQVVLHNDDHNRMEHVVICLMRVFQHPLQLAVKIMLEAHHRGRAVAEVEGESPARRHRAQLQSFGLTATVNKV